MRPQVESWRPTRIWIHGFSAKKDLVVNEIAFIMQPSPGSNDHQVRIVVDGLDIIMQYDEDSLGIDPPDFLSDRALLDSGELTFARCCCGVVGCDDATVQTSRDERIVTWCDFSSRMSKIESFVFCRNQFDAAVAAAKTNHDWESTERAAERLIAEMPYVHGLAQALSFRWASGRLNPNKISVCFDLNSEYQIILHALWDHQSTDAAVKCIEAELRKPPEQWSDVEYYPQTTNLSPPTIAGSRWRCPH